jgi:hypothetical protein
VGLWITFLSSKEISCVNSWLAEIEILKIWTPILAFINILVLVALNVFVRNSAKQGVEKQIEIQKQGVEKLKDTKQSLSLNFQNIQVRHRLNYTNFLMF